MKKIKVLEWSFFHTLVVIFIGLIALSIYQMDPGNTGAGSFNDLQSKLTSQTVNSISITNREEVEYSTTDSNYTFLMPSEVFEAKLDKLYTSGVDEVSPYYKKTNSISFGNALMNFLPLIVFIGIIVYFYRKNSKGAAGSPQGQKGKNINLLPEVGIKTRFKDVAGNDEAKAEIEEIVDFLKFPLKYQALGARIPKGLLMEGPPGTGKTLLAKAVAGEANVPFFSMAGSDFVEMFVGVGASRVRDLFKEARKHSPSIVFIDEIDAIGKARGNGTNGNQEQENTLNALLTEMDGFKTDETVIILAATNRADILDKALGRAGRFDRTVTIGLPELNDRIDIFKVHLKAIKTVRRIDSELLAKQTPGFSGADIANVCNEAALIAARKNKKVVNRADFDSAIDKIVIGLEKKNKIVKPEERRKIAFHEAGHALVSTLCEHASPLVKVTITPRGRSLGAAWYLPEERQLSTPKNMLDEMCATLAGRAAEKVIFDEISTGALSDLEKANKVARNMVTIYGLSEELLNITYYNQGNGQTKPYSEQQAQVIELEVAKIINKQYKRALELVLKNKDKLTQITELLLEKESILKVDVDNIVLG